MDRSAAEALPGDPAAGLPPQPIDRLVAPFREFSQAAASGGILLLAAALVALVWANSPFAASYDELFHTPLTVSVGGYELSGTLHFWINDALMAFFFLLVGLELKREVLVGELASARKAILPVAAAAGGAVLPAILFFLIVGGAGPAARGWGVPMATDIAFALGILALVGSRAPLGLKIFLTALAIVDDLVAVVVIALFYTDDLAIGALAAAGGVLVALLVANRLGVRQAIVYALLGLALWLAVLQSGVHASIAGVLLALTIPARRRIDSADFAARAGGILDRFREESRHGPSIEDHHATLWELEDMTEKAQAPMLRIEHALHPWVSFLIVPLFALANAGVAIEGDIATLAGDPVVLGVFVGLVVGKQFGILGASWLIVRSGLAALPDGVGWRHVYGVAWLGGIGFTMSLFIGELAYGESDALALAKIGILAASIVAGIGGLLVLRTVRDAPPEPE
ncbi:MAG TPA: Na+/H+ antiporter NhaA [Candidatus Limnocylindrales bacterium]|nr:Na+/H+ antiporter NhaA [Candidatus Limnocylindrales bacterium]